MINERDFDIFEELIKEDEAEIRFLIGWGGLIFAIMIIGGIALLMVKP